MTHARTLAVLALLAAAATARAQESSSSGSSGNTVVGFALGLGTEQGAGGSGGSTMLEAEGTLGYEFHNRIRPELGLVLGLEPDTHGAVRPGVRFPLRRLPVQIRAALDASNARNQSFSWRYVFLGAATELKLTATFALSLEFDTGIPLRDSAGVPFMIRFGSVVRP